MDLRWYAQFEARDEDSQKKVYDSLRSANLILEGAIGLLEKDLATLQKTTHEDYDSPSWSHKQAHINGEIAALKKVINLLTIKEINND